MKNRTATAASTTAVATIQVIVCEPDPPALPVPLSVFVADATGAELTSTAIVKEAVAIGAIEAMSRVRAIIRVEA